MKKYKHALLTGILLTMAGCQSTGSDLSPGVEEVNGQSKSEPVNAQSVFEGIKRIHVTWSEKIASIDAYKIYSAALVKDVKDTWDDTVDVYKDMEEDPTETTEDYSLFSSDTYAEKYEELLAETETLYQELVTLKDTADEVLAESMAQMVYLDKLGAEEAFATSYRSVFSSYTNLFKYVAKNKIVDAQVAQGKFLEKAKELEVKVVLKKYIAPMKSELSSLLSKRINNVAPLSYSKAKAKVEEAELTVRTDSRDFDEIEVAVQAAQFEIEHTVSVSNEVKRLSGVLNNKFEPVVLGYEKSLHAISEAVGAKDVRNQSLEQQADSILDTLESNKAENASLSGELSTALASAKEQIEVLIQKAKDAVVESELAKKALEQEKANSERLSELLKSFTDAGATKLKATATPTLSQPANTEATAQPNTAEEPSTTIGT